MSSKRFYLLSLYVDFTAYRLVNLNLIRSSLGVPHFHHSMALRNLYVIAILLTYFSSWLECAMTWLRSSSISLDGYAPKTREATRCRPAVTNEAILATKQEFFFTKVAPVQSITNIVLLDFLLMLLYWMFILSYNPIYFSANKFIFSNVYV